MKILFLTNYYPPARYGWGYMQLCEEVADGLSARGHSVAVLTSTHFDGDKVLRTYPVYRYIQLDPDWYSPHSAARQFFFGRRKRERRAVEHVNELLRSFEPDIVFVWHAVGLPKAMLAEAERYAKGKMVYYLADYQPELADEYMDYWQGEPVHTLARLVKRPLSRLALAILAREGKPVRLKYEHVICVSRYVRQRLLSRTLIPPSSVVIHNGVDLSKFRLNGKSKQKPEGDGLRCLVAGRVMQEKGIHTVVDAFAQLKSREQLHGVSLTILGDGPEPYVSSLRKKIEANRLQEHIQFQPPVDRSTMPEILSEYDALLLPSEYDEPLARAIQEGMAMGLLVIGTVTGGSGELLVDGKTGLVFEAGNSASLAEKLLFARRERDLVSEVRKAGQAEILNNFNIASTIAQIENYLLTLVKSPDSYGKAV
jgi:glycosyltransferase involved in cell wall biosynthesis